MLRRLGDEPAARRMFERNIAIAEKAYGPEHLETAVALSALAYHEYALGNMAIAYQLSERSLEIQIRALGARARRLAIAYFNLACIDALEGNRRGALGYLQMASDTGWSWRGIETDTDLDSLRGDPEFEAIVTEFRRRIAAGE